MSDADQILDEILVQIREREVPAFPRDAISTKVDGVRKIRAGDDDVGSAPTWRRARQFIATGVLAVSVVVAAIWLFSTIEIGSALAFSEVQEAVAAKQTIRYRVLNPNDSVSEITYSGNRIRNEQPNDPMGTISIADFEKGVMMLIWPRRVTAVISPIYGTDELKQFEAFRAMLRNVSESSQKRLPDREVDGRPVNEFLVRKDDRDYTISVDPKTKLPIRIRIGEGKDRMVFTDFQFDVPVDESLFRMEAPDGYYFSNRVPRNNRPQPPESMEIAVSPEHGIGPVKFGTKVEDIVRLLGEPDWRDDWEYTELGYDRRGFRLIANAKLGLYGIRCFNKHGGAPTAVGFRGKTKEGIAIDATLDDVLKTYGKPDAQLDSVVFYRKQGYEFWFRDKKLVSIRVGRPSPNSRVEVKGNAIIER
jgi:hypothetical protein